MTVSFVARLLQGVADASITVTMPSIVCREFPQKQERYLGYLNTAIGVGTCVGPLLSAILLNYLSYFATFGLLTFLIGMSALVM